MYKIGIDVPCDFMDEIVLKEVQYMATLDTSVVWNEKDAILQRKVRKKARWLLKNWLMSSEQWQEFVNNEH